MTDKTKELNAKISDLIQQYTEESYTVTEAAKLTGFTKSLLSQECKQNISAFKIGRNVYIEKSELYRYLYHRQGSAEFFRLLQMNGFGKMTLDELVDYLESLES